MGGVVRVGRVVNAIPIVRVVSMVGVVRVGRVVSGINIVRVVSIGRGGRVVRVKVDGVVDIVAIVRVVNNDVAICSCMIFVGWSRFVWKYQKICENLLSTQISKPNCSLQEMNF